MAPKHGLSTDEQFAKRAKSSETRGASRSTTPADPNNKVEFEVKYPNLTGTKRLSKKEQEYVNTAEHQISPFVARGAKKEGELDQYYAITPFKEWDAMKKYSNFIIQGEVYKNNQVVFVRNPTSTESHGEHSFWVGRILQVKAKNAQHVYALIAWLYWPEELPREIGKAIDLVNKETGRRKYHGTYELVASNYMEVVDVLTFAGKADVSQWLEDDDTPKTKLYWRQSYCRESQELSKIREHCICNGHFNPDGEAMYICDNSNCGLWQHKNCIIDTTLNKLLDHQADTNGNISGKKNKRKPYTGKLAAKIIQDGEKPPVIEISDLRADAEQKKWRENVQCLKCSTQLL